MTEDKKLIKPWRPEGWKTIPLWSRLCDGRPITSTHEAYEAGADAMLEALINLTQSHVNEVGHLKAGDKGYLVYIPEEQNGNR